MNPFYALQPPPAVEHALLRATSALVPTLGRFEQLRGVAMSRDVARRGAVSGTNATEL
ncbi:MAG TPA: hypothetical protein VN841_01865 [Bryobacteraceae bacterium]|nr:hypothetical protein [Bryobacteraceae bacterium]